MSPFGRPDEAGRSSGKVNGRRGRALGPPSNEPWIWQTRALLQSPAWRVLSLYGRQFIDFLHVEHMNHAGQHNGKLIATYGQLTEAGIPKKHIKSAIFEATELGLVTVTHRGQRDDPNLYELNTLPVIGRLAMPNLWKRVTEAEAAAVKEMVRKLRTQSRGKSGAFKSAFAVHNAGTALAPHAGTAKGSSSSPALAANDAENGTGVVPALGAALISSPVCTGDSGSAAAIDRRSKRPQTRARNSTKSAG